MFNKSIRALKFYITFLFVSFLIFSCESELKSTEFKTIEINNNYAADISVVYDVAEGNSELASTINKNIEQVVLQSISSYERQKDIKTILDDFNKEYLKFKSEFPDESDPKWELFIETEMTYQSAEVITIAISTYEFQGGAHGNDKIVLMNLDANTGHVLNINDIINDIDAFRAIAKSYFIKELETQEDDLKIEDFFFGKPFQLPENLGYSEEGLIILYNTYEVSSYAQGYTEFVIPFDEITSILKYN